jgi:hypothetical protein
MDITALLDSSGSSGQHAINLSNIQQKTNLQKRKRVEETRSEVSSSSTQAMLFAKLVHA